MNTDAWEPISAQLASARLGYRLSLVKSGGVWPIPDPDGQWWEYKHSGTGFLRRPITNHY